MKTEDVVKRFWELDAEKPFSPAETKLFFFLLNKAISNKSIGEQFECSLLPIMLPKVLPKMVMLRARDKLTQRGLIQYVSGNGKSRIPTFVICPVTNNVTKGVTNKEKTSPKPPRKEIEREKENISKEIQKKEREWSIDFALPGYVKPLTEWLEYKKDRKQTYKSEKQIRLCYQNLVKLSNNNPAIAQMIVEQSIANNWAGLFELKNNGTENRRAYTSKQEANDYAYNQFLAKRAAKEQGLVVEVEDPF